MATFYQDDLVLVTSELVEVDGRRYLLADLADVRDDGRLRAAKAWLYWLVRQVAAVVFVLLFFPGVVVAIAIAVELTSSTAADRWVGIGVALGVWQVLLCICGGIAFDDDDTREIRARWRGDEVVLLRTTNLRGFGRIYQAIRRASSSRTS